MDSVFAFSHACYLSWVCGLERGAGSVRTIHRIPKETATAGKVAGRKKQWKKKVTELVYSCVDHKQQNPPSFFQLVCA